MGGEVRAEHHGRTPTEELQSGSKAFDATATTTTTTTTRRRKEKYRGMFGPDGFVGRCGRRGGRIKDSKRGYRGYHEGGGGVQRERRGRGRGGGKD